MTTSKAEIRKKAVEILQLNPKGIHYMDWVRKIQEALPDANPNTIQGTVWDLDRQLPSEVYKPARGIWRHVSFRGEEAPAEVVSGTVHVTEGKPISESDFYAPFADWLVRGIEECTKAIALGGNVFKDKFGTPDVIGIYKSARYRHYQDPHP